MQKKYKIINTTIKPPRVCPKTKEDLRSTVERVGHGVSFRTDDGQHVVVPVNQPRLVSTLNEGILRLARGHFIRIEEVDDVVTALKQHTLQPQSKSEAQAPVRSRRVGAEVQSTESSEKVQDSLFSPDQDAVANSDIVAHPASRRQARAVEMGKDDYRGGEGKEYEGATNPDGNPNFLVTVPKNMKRKERFKKG